MTENQDFLLSTGMHNIGNWVTATVGKSRDWPLRAQSNYKVLSNDSTYSSIEENFDMTIPMSDVDFANEIARIYATLVEGQEPLGVEFEAVWDENIDILYES